MIAASARPASFLEVKPLGSRCFPTSTSPNGVRSRRVSVLLARILSQILYLTQNGDAIGSQVLFGDWHKPDDPSVGSDAERICHECLNQS